ncbi:MAG: zinc ribbon domain-containing protein [Candidatus Dormibacter sp.]
MTPLIADTASLFVLGVIAAGGYVAAMYVAIAFFVWRDARRRSDSIAFQLFALLLGFVPPFLGALVYLMVRPPTTLEHERQIALEEQAILDAERAEIAVRPCPSCGRDIEAEFIVCPHCRTQFARRCRSCDRVLRLGWPVCPYCAEEVGHAPLGRVTRTG